MIYVVAMIHARSGSSLMMSMIQASGIPLAYSKRREQRLHKADGESYSAQADLFYEINPREYTEIGFPLKYENHAIKVLADGLFFLAEHEYRILVMQRDVEEIRQSCRFGIRNALNEYVLDNYDSYLEHITGILRSRRDVLSCDIVNYREVVLNPDETLKPLQWLNIEKAKSVIRPEFYRFRREFLEAA